MSESNDAMMAYNQRCNVEPPEPQVDKVPSKWMAIGVEYGDSGKHLYVAEGHSPRFFATEAEADRWAKEHCAYDQKAIVAVLKVERLIKAAAVTFETIT